MEFTTQLFLLLMVALSASTSNAEANDSTLPIQEELTTLPLQRHEAVLQTTDLSLATDGERSTYRVFIDYMYSASHEVSFGVIAGFEFSEFEPRDEKAQSSVIGFGPTFNFLEGKATDRAFLDLRINHRETNQEARFFNGSDSEQFFEVRIGKRFEIFKNVSYRPMVAYTKKFKDNDGFIEDGVLSLRLLSFSLIF